MSRAAGRARSQPAPARRGWWWLRLLCPFGCLLPLFEDSSNHGQEMPTNQQEVHATPVPGTGPSEVQRAVDLGTEELDGDQEASGPPFLALSELDTTTGSHDALPPTAPLQEQEVPSLLAVNHALGDYRKRGTTLESSINVATYGQDSMETTDNALGFTPKSRASSTETDSALSRNLPDMGPQPSKSTPEAAQPGIGQAGNPQHDMKVPPADTIIDAHAESAAQEEPRTCLTLSTYVIYTSQVAWGPPLATLTKTPRSLPVAELDTEGMPGFTPGLETKSTPKALRLAGAAEAGLLLRTASADPDALVAATVMRAGLPLDAAEDVTQHAAASNALHTCADLADIQQGEDLHVMPALESSSDVATPCQDSTEPTGSALTFTPGSRASSADTDSALSMDSDAPEMETDQPDMGSESFKSTPDAALSDVDQAGSPQPDMEGPPADIDMNAHMDSLDALSDHRAADSAQEESDAGSAWSQGGSQEDFTSEDEQSHSSCASIQAPDAPSEGEEGMGDPGTQLPLQLQVNNAQPVQAAHDQDTLLQGTANAQLDPIIQVEDLRKIGKNRQLAVTRIENSREQSLWGAWNNQNTITEDSSGLALWDPSNPFSLFGMTEVGAICPAPQEIGATRTDSEQGALALAHQGEGTSALSGADKGCPCLGHADPAITDWLPAKQISPIRPGVAQPQEDIDSALTCPDGFLFNGLDRQLLLGYQPEEPSLFQLGLPTQQGSFFQLGASMQQGALFQMEASMQQDSLFQLGASTQQDSLFQLGASMQQGSLFQMEGSMQQDSLFQLGASTQQDSLFQLGASTQQGSLFQQEVTAAPASPSSAAFWEQPGVKQLFACDPFTERLNNEESWAFRKGFDFVPSKTPRRSAGWCSERRAQEVL